MSTAEQDPLAAQIEALIAGAEKHSSAFENVISGPLAPDQVVPVITPKQGARLRRYFESRSSSLSAGLDVIDLDLAGMGLIRLTQSRFGLYIHITVLGTHALYRFRQQTLDERRPHHQLASRLSAWLRASGRITWEGIEFKVEATKRTYAIRGGPKTIVYDRPFDGHVRPDVFSIEPAQMMPRHIKPMVHEVKMSRADLFADMAKPEKREGYAAVAETVYYAAPAGILVPDDIPEEFGLVIETEEGKFQIAKRAKRRKIELAPAHYLKPINRPGTFPDKRT